MNNQKKECNKYREERKKKKKFSKNNDCEQKLFCNVKCSKKKMKKSIKPCLFNDEMKCNDLLNKIKPPLYVREKYTNPQHVVCFNEKTQNTRKQNGIIYTTAEEGTFQIL